jgi:hypothetical protein
VENTFEKKRKVENTKDRKYPSTPGSQKHVCRVYSQSKVEKYVSKTSADRVEIHVELVIAAVKSRQKRKLGVSYRVIFSAVHA